MRTPALKKRFLNKYGYWWKRKFNYDGQGPRQRRRTWAKFSLSGNRPLEEKQRLVALYLQDNPDDKTLAVAVLRGDKATAGGKRLHVNALATWLPEWASLYEPGDGVPGDAMFPAGGGALADSAADGTRSAGEPMASDHASAPYPRGFPIPPCIAERAGGERKVPTVADFHAGKKAEDTAAMAAALRAQVCVQEAWGRFDAAVQEWRKILSPVHKAAWCMELCVDTWLSTGAIRVHFHLAVCDSARIPPDFPSHLCWDGCAPHMAPSTASRARNDSAAMYYVSSVKASSVFAASNTVAHETYSVKASWIWGALGSGKMTAAVARAELTRIPNGFKCNMANLSAWERQRLQDAVDAWRSWRECHTDEKIRPWRVFPQVQLWRAQYSRVMNRYKFLVLDGASRLGKTAYARHIAGASRTLEISMSGGGALDMGSYDPMQHDVVIVDEADPQTILDHKKLFQAGPSDVALQTSATNCHSLVVNVAGKMIIVCSNVWASRLNQLPFEGAMWIRANQFYQRLRNVMWVTDPEDDLPMSLP